MTRPKLAHRAGSGMHVILDRFAVFAGRGQAASFTLAWVALHRERLRLVFLGGKRLGVMFFYDTGGKTDLPKISDQEVDAMAVIVYGPKGKNA